jgi:DTW domain-containing protein YfiP
VEVRIVMCAREHHSTSNTARLLGLWLPSAGRFVRGALAMSGEPSSDPLAGIDLSRALLLYPDEQRDTGQAPETNLAARSELAPHGVQLIVPDGTWGQARRLVRRRLLSLALPRLSLDPGWPSIYRLRRKPQGLCTFEAIAVALARLDGPELAAELLQRFALWNERQAQVKTGGPGDFSLTSAPPHPALARLLPSRCPT